jgi:FKBP-type peptidyl-prolyl cis-trans isomerase
MLFIKLTKRLLLAILLVAFLDGFGQKNVPAAAVKLKTKEDSVQYALGVYMGQWMMSNGFVSLDLNLMTTGIADVYRNRPRPIKDENIGPMITGYQAALQKDFGKKLELQLFNAIKDKPGIGKLPSGVQYIVQKPGKGLRPSETDSVLLNFKGTLPNGVVFEDTYAKKIAVAATPGTLIPGLREALQMMPEGAVWELYIPSAMAFGDKGNGTNVPPNSAVIIVVELMAVKRNG